MSHELGAKQPAKKPLLESQTRTMPETVPAFSPTLPLFATIGQDKNSPSPVHRALQQAAILQLQQQLGNQFVQQQLIQRQVDAGLPAGVPQPTNTPQPPLPTFQFASKSEQNEWFDSEYTPVAPVPAMGVLDIALWVNIQYKNFSRAMMRQEPYRSFRFSRQQMGDFAWTDDEKEQFETRFMTSVQDAWSGQHLLHLQDPTFSEYRCRVQISVVSISEPAMAHTKITAQKVPAGAPRFRSFVAGDEATLDIRDPSEPETNRVRSRPHIWRVAPFDLGSSTLTPELEAQIQPIIDTLRHENIAPGVPVGGQTWAVRFIGRSSSPGSRVANEALSVQRAESVHQRVSTALGWSTSGMVAGLGEQNATEDANFQRVDVFVASDQFDTQQNVAAHEAGHMFGLGDEYVEEENEQFFGDRPDHYQDVQDLVGTEAADQTLMQDSDSIMSMGGRVQRGHYVYFVQALNEITGKQWQVE